MKLILLVLLYLSLSYASNLRNLSSTPSPKCVLFFKGLNFTGDSNECCESDNKITSDTWKNKYSSVKLGSDVEYLTVYSKNDFEGNTLTYRTDQADLGPLDNDIQSYSINTKFSDDCVRFLENRHFIGQSWTVCKSKTSVNINNQDKYNRVQFGSNIKRLQLFSKTYYQASQSSDIETRTTGGNIQDNQFRSIQVNHENLPDNCVWLFQVAGYSGPYMEFCSWTSDIGIKAGGIGSIWLGDNVKSITVYDEIDYKGESNIYTSNKIQLGTWHNRIHSIKIS